MELGWAGDTVTSAAARLHHHLRHGSISMCHVGFMI
jgi:hypothetical protein